jgi:hypothetical protein
MDHEILRKLRHELTSELVSESQVTYVMVEIRKFLDHSRDQGGSAPEFKALRMFCDWVVHVGLTGYGKETILEDFDNAYSQRRIWADVEKTEDVYSLGPLREELLRFAKSNDLPTMFVEEGVAWGRFLKLYASIVSECPLHYRPSHEPKHIKSARLIFGAVPDDALSESHARVGVQWDWLFVLADGSQHSVKYRYLF